MKYNLDLERLSVQEYKTLLEATEFTAGARADVLSLPLDNEVKLMISDSRKMGKLNYFPLVFDLRSDEMFEAVFMLADFRKSTK
jgi:hypothetical protein